MQNKSETQISSDSQMQKISPLQKALNTELFYRLCPKGETIYLGSYTFERRPDAELIDPSDSLHDKSAIEPNLHEVLGIDRRFINNLSIVDLIKMGADINCKFTWQEKQNQTYKTWPWPSYESTPLELAAISNSLEGVIALVENGANINNKTNISYKSLREENRFAGKRPLDIAISEGSPEVAIYLISIGAKVEKGNNKKGQKGYWERIINPDSKRSTLELLEENIIKHGSSRDQLERLIREAINQSAPLTPIPSAPLTQEPSAPPSSHLTGGEFEKSEIPTSGAAEPSAPPSEQKDDVGELDKTLNKPNLEENKGSDNETEEKGELKESSDNWEETSAPPSENSRAQKPSYMDWFSHAGLKKIERMAQNLLPHSLHRMPRESDSHRRYYLETKFDDLPPETKKNVLNELLYEAVKDRDGEVYLFEKNADGKIEERKLTLSNLIKTGADLEYVHEDSFSKSTPIIYAAEKGDLSKISTLLGAKADLSATNASGDTALTVATKEFINYPTKKHFNSCVCLLGYSADTNIKSSEGKTAIDYVVEAIQKTHKDERGALKSLAYRLIQAGADINTAFSGKNLGLAEEFIERAVLSGAKIPEESELYKTYENKIKEAERMVKALESKTKFRVFAEANDAFEGISTDSANAYEPEVAMAAATIVEEEKSPETAVPSAPPISLATAITSFSNEETNEPSAPPLPPATNYFDPNALPEAPKHGINALPEVPTGDIKVSAKEKLKNTSSLKGVPSKSLIHFLPS